MKQVRGDIFWRIGVDADVDVGVLPRHGDHFVSPRNTDVDSQELQIGKVDSDLIEQDRSSHAGQANIALIDQVLADLHHDRHV